MFSSAINNLFSISILLIFTSTSVFSDCSYSQNTCRQGLITWCCSLDETCGTDLGFCHDDSTLPPAAIAIIIMASICCFITCLSCCIHSHQRQQRLQTNFANANTRMNTNPYQQQVIHGPVRVVHVRPVSYVGAVPTSRSFPSIYEAPPPSYEIATASLPSIHGSSSSYPPMIATVEQSHSSIV